MNNGFLFTSSQLSTIFIELCHISSAFLHEASRSSWNKPLCSPSPYSLLSILAVFLQALLVDPWHWAPSAPHLCFAACHTGAAFPSVPHPQAAAASLPSTELAALCYFLRAQAWKFPCWYQQTALYSVGGKVSVRRGNTLEKENDDTFVFLVTVSVEATETNSSPSAGAELTLSDSVCLPPEVLCCVTARSWGHLWDQWVMHIPGCPIPALMGPCHCGNVQFGTQGWSSGAKRRAAVARGDGREQNIALLCSTREGERGQKKRSREAENWKRLLHRDA